MHPMSLILYMISFLTLDNGPCRHVLWRCRSLSSYIDVSSMFLRILLNMHCFIVHNVVQQLVQEGCEGEDYYSSYGFQGHHVPGQGIL